MLSYGWENGRKVESGMERSMGGKEKEGGGGTQDRGRRRRGEDALLVRPTDFHSLRGIFQSLNRKERGVPNPPGEEG